MKNSLQLFFGLLMIFFTFGNVYLVITGVNLSKQIHEYEVNVTKYKEENIYLETEVSKVSSLQHASSISAVLTIDQSIQPIYLNHSPFALNR